MAAPKHSVKDDGAPAKGKAVTAAKSKTPAESPPLTHLEIRAIVIGIMLAMGLGALDQTIVATALPTIGRAFGEVENLSWVVTAYLLTATAVTPLYGKLSDIYGRRRMLLAGILIFIAGSVACALAPSLTALIFFRGLQGLGGGGLLSLAQTIIGDIVSPRERGRYQGYIGTVFAISSIGGPVLGGFLAQHLHWSLIFWINLPLGLAALAMSHRTLIRLPRHERPHKLDVFGAILMMAAAIALMLALTWGGTRFPWISAQIGTLLLGSALLWAAFSWRLMSAGEPFLPISILKNPVVRAGTLSGACTMGTMVGLTIFVPLYFEVVPHLSASQSGLALIPLMTSVVVASTLTGRAMVHMERYKRMPLAGLSVSIMSLGVLAIWPSGLPLVVVIALLAVSGFGIGTVYPVTTVSVQNAVARAQLGTATGAMNFFRLLGSALVVALLGAIVLGGIGGGAGVSLEVLQKSAANVDLANVFRFVFLAAALVLGFALAFLIAMEERALRGPVTQKQTAPAPATPITPEPEK